MPNRGIKESICTSKTLNQLEPSEEVLFYRLIVNCDDYGRMLADSEIILSKCFPRRIGKISVDDIEMWIKSLFKVGLIELYINDDERYLQFTKWSKHQRIRASDSKYPAPDDEESILLTLDGDLLTNDSECLQDDENCNQLLSDAPETRDTRHETRVRTKKVTHMPEKVKYAEFVSMPEDDYQKLIDLYGQEQTTWMIEKLNDYKGSNGKKYKSDYLAIKNWVVKAYDEENKRASPVNKEALPFL